MIRNKSEVIIAVLLALFAGCAPVSENVQNPIGDAPVLIGQATFVPSTPTPSPMLNIGVQATLEPESLESGLAENRSELFPSLGDDLPGFVLVTPTLPPSKTPTPFLTATLPPSQTPDGASLPDSTIIEIPPSNSGGGSTPPPAMPGNPPPVMVNPPQLQQPACGIPWQFNADIVGMCPLAPANVFNGVYQSFEKEGRASYMFWVEPRIVYVMYGDGQAPHWRQYLDTYVPGQDPAYEPGLDYPPEFAPERPSINHWQPRWGFGKLWRDNVTPLDIRVRIGWADIEWEIPYLMTVQRGQDGTVYFNDPFGRVFAMPPNGGAWTLIQPRTSGVVVPPSPIGGGALPLPPNP